MIVKEGLIPASQLRNLGLRPCTFLISNIFLSWVNSDPVTSTLTFLRVILIRDLEKVISDEAGSYETFL